MSTHSYELEVARLRPSGMDLQSMNDRGECVDPAGIQTPDSNEDYDDDLMYDLIGAAVRGFYTPYHPIE